MAARRVCRFVVLLSLLLLSLPQFASPATTWVRPYPHGQTYWGVQCFGNGVAWTAAEAGRLCTSSDYGATWRMLESFKNVTTPLRGVAFASLTRGFVTTTAGTLYLTWDGGATWSSRTIAGAGSLVAADWADTTTALAISPGVVIRTVDGGNTWTSSTGPSGARAIRHVSGSLWFIVGDLGIFRSTDNGATWTNVRSGHLFSIDFTDANNGIAVGDGFILRTTDGGTTWTNASGFTTGSNWDVRYVTPTIAVATTFAGLVVRSIDGGSSWTAATLSGERFPMYAVSFFDALNGLAVGGYGQILATADGGASWTTRTLRLDHDYGQVENITDFVRTGSQTWFLTASSGLYRTTDNGATFSRLQPLGWNSVSFSDPANGVAIGGVPTGGGFGIWHTTDGGATWTGSNSPLPMSLDIVRFGPGGVALIAGDRGIIRSTDGGASWTSVYYPGSVISSRGLGWADANNVFLSGPNAKRSTDGGATWTDATALNYTAGVSFATPLVGTALEGTTGARFLRTVDGGATWAAPPPQLALNPPATGMRRVSMSGPYTGWAVGDSGIVMHTINGGASWVRTSSTTNDPLNVVVAIDDSTAIIAGGLGGALIVVTSLPSKKPAVWNLVPTGTSATLYDVSFATPTIGLMCASGGLILRTTDGGATWTSIAAAPSGIALFGVTFVTSTVAICVGTGGTVLRSTDAGLTWSAVSSGTTSALLDVGFASATIGCAVGQGVMVRTTDGGISWTPVANPAPAGSSMYGVAFGDGLTGLCVAYAGTGSTIQRTLDAGATWTTVATYPGTFLLDVAFATPTTAAVVSAGGAFYAARSTDAGLTWASAGAETHLALYGVCFVSSTEGYAVGVGGTILHTTDAGMTWLLEPTDIQPPPVLLTGGAPPNLPGLEALSPANTLTAADLYGVSARGGSGAIASGASGTAVLHAGDVTTPTLLAFFNAEWTTDGIELQWQFGAPGSFVSAEFERSTSAVGPWGPVSGERREVSETAILLDRDVELGQTYYYHLVATRQDGSMTTFGPIVVTAGRSQNDFALLAVAPSPTRDVARIDFTVAREARVRLSVLDIQGRRVARLVDAVNRPGHYQMVWDGSGERGRAAAGLYFVRYEWPGQHSVRRLLLVR